MSLRIHASLINLVFFVCAMTDQFLKSKVRFLFIKFLFVVIYAQVQLLRSWLGGMGRFAYNLIYCMVHIAQI